MASLWMDHFGQYYDLADMLQGTWSQIGGNVAISTANPPRAGQSHMRFTCGGGVNAGQMRRRLGAAKTTAGWATRLYVDQLPAKEPETGEGLINNVGVGIRQWRNGVNNIQLTTILGTDGTISVYTGQPAVGLWAPSRLHRSAQCIFPKSYHHIEDKIVCAGGTSGSYELRVDGVTRINLPGINTDPTGAGEVSQASVGIVSQGDTLAMFMDMADVHAWDDQAGDGLTDFGGNLGVLARALNADTSDAGWSLSTGAAGYALLIDKNATTYIEADSTTLKSGFTGAALAAGASGIVAQQLSFRGLKTDGGDCSVKPGFKSGSSETDLAAQPMTEGEVWRWGIVGNDPATSAPWTRSGVNASSAVLLRSL